MRTKQSKREKMEIILTWTTCSSVALGSIILAFLSLQDVANRLPSKFQLREFMMSSWHEMTCTGLPFSTSQTMMSWSKPALAKTLLAEGCHFIMPTFLRWPIKSMVHSSISFSCTSSGQVQIYTEQWKFCSCSRKLSVKFVIANKKNVFKCLIHVVQSSSVVSKGRLANSRSYSLYFINSLKTTCKLV